MQKRLLSILGAACIAFGATQAAHAALTSFQTFVGHVGVSTDGFGSTSESGVISAEVPTGATVLGAYLYSATFFGGSAAATLNGSPVTFGPQVPNPSAACCSLASARADVTSIIAPIINGGAGGVYNFNIIETGANQDGEALVVAYQLASLPEATVGILDGFTAVGGDTTTINFATPLDPTAAGFFAEMRLGIGFSCCTTQSSTVAVNGTPITNNAGNNDDSADGGVSNGNLITVGGFNDPFSPLLPNYEQDHERYNLASFISAGATSISVQTNNPSNDDNIFLAVAHVSGIAGINEPPPSANPVPEPGTLLLLGAGLAGLTWWRRKQT